MINSLKNLFRYRQLIVVLVSRELKVPCVIGTKYATKLFDDGDEVEVDADKGIIKKLS